MKSTVNELLVLKNSLEKRSSQVQSLLHQSSRRSVHEYTMISEGSRRDVDESRYDPDDLEHKLAELNLAIFEIDRAIKVANAATVVDVDVNVKELLAPVKPRPWQNKE